MQPVGVVFLLISMQMLMSFGMQMATDERWGFNSSVQGAPVYRTISVKHDGSGDFTSIQRAVDSVPSHNNQWIRIHVSRGFYGEKVLITADKPFIYLEGEGTWTTLIYWGDASNTRKSPTFEVRADNFVAKYITFKNTFNHPLNSDLDGMRQAVAALVSGDKNSFYNCAFIGLQDTLWDNTGRHYYKQCYIEGAVDFIFGAAQSTYEGCTLYVTASSELPRGGGAITAQGRERPTDPGGFVFLGPAVGGTGPVYLGRAWKAASRVLFYKASLNIDVVPAGWDSWSFAGREGSIVYVEVGCTGKGSNMSKRVKWEKQLSSEDLTRLITLQSYINQDGWLQTQP